MIELELIKKFPQEIIAVDEVGRGPLCGPVVIGAVRLFIHNRKELTQLLGVLRKLSINDSKKISPLQRRSIIGNLGIQLLDYRLTDKLIIDGVELSFLTWEMNHEVVDQENILAASLRGMKEASLELSILKNEQTIILIDGNKKFRWINEQPGWKEIPIVKGDQKSLLIGLASIIAKEKRDEHMKVMHEIYPQYGFNQHFGYPTAKHKKAIQEYGPCPIHRKTFAGVKEFVGHSN